MREPIEGVEGRVPVAGDGDPGYPTLSDVAAARRRVLKLFALTAAAGSLGLELTGCPPPGAGGSGGGGGGIGGGGGGGGGGTEWLPWEPEVRMAGEMECRVGAPVAVVLGGGPIRVRFRDGVEADLVAAAVVVPIEGQDVAAEVTARAAEHADAVRREAAQAPAAALDVAADLDALEARLLAALRVQSGYFQEVSLARARAAAPPPPPREREALREDPGVAREEAAPAADVAPVGTGSPSAPPARAIWAPCRTPGCTKCGAR